MDLMKTYNDNNKKYNGELYDILDVKLQIFYDYYNKIRLPEDQYQNAFLLMLKDYASDFYYSRITRRPYDFTTMVSMVKRYFETKENQ
jgi:hypothetical protein